MSNLILHQYTESPFSEKVRALLGFKNATYQQVETSVIMPRDALMPLTGGYRRIPVMQAGADIYCDTAIMCRVIDAQYPENSIYPQSRQAVVESCALWTDTFFFTVCVAVAFQPASLANEPLFKDEESAAAFMADRAQLSEGSNQLTMPFEIAEPHFISHLTSLERQLGASAWLFGDEPTIADFSTYHILWFIDRRPVLQHYFEPFPNVRAWYERIRAFGHGNVETLSGEQALGIAAASEPAGISDPVIPQGFTSGQQVSVMPIDYGFQPVNGGLLTASTDEIALARNDRQAGSIVVHFPRMGFQLNPVTV